MIKVKNKTDEYRGGGGREMEAHHRRVLTRVNKLRADGARWVWGMS